MKTAFNVTVKKVSQFKTNVSFDEERVCLTGKCPFAAQCG